MNKVRTLQPVAFAAGTRLALTAGQVNRRAHALKKLGEGLYETTAAVQFKVGEEFGFDGELAKNLVEIVVDAKSGKPLEKKPAAKAKPREADKAAQQPLTDGED